MAQTEVIDALGALARVIEAWERETAPAARVALLGRFPLEAAAHCGRAFVDAGVFHVLVIDDDGSITPIGNTDAPWSGLLLFAMIAKTAKGLRTTRDKIVRRAIDHAARVARASATTTIEAR